MIPEFDPNKPYGTITGHPSACYEQDGYLFGPEGRLARPPSEGVIIMRDERTSDSLENAKAFLRQVLADGRPILKSAIYTEALQNNQVWADVTEAFNALGVRVEKAKSRGAPIMWKLPETSNA